jgi:hypothetical protein
VAVLLAVLNPSLSAASAQIVLTSKQNGLQSQSEFACSGFIHAYLTLPEKAVDQHVLEGVWIMPDGKVLQDNRIPVTFSSPRRTAYLWLMFEPPASGLLTTFNSQQDEERVAYNGQWQLKVKWDEKPLLEKSFTVHCS